MSTSDLKTTIQANIEELRQRIHEACAHANRNPDSVCLIAVSKTHGPERIEPALQAGLTTFGENRVQEAMEKWPTLRASWPKTELHLIGPLQTNKTKEAVQTFDVIHSVDRMKLARKLKSTMDAEGKSLSLFVQVNTGEEEQKAGIFPKDADDFIRQCREEIGLNVSGLMCIPPIDEEPSLHFALLAKIAARNGIESLSMGMTSDFETAIEFGATHIRVGTFIFGNRQTTP